MQVWRRVHCRVHFSVECTVLWQGPPFCGVHCSMAGSTFLWSALFYGRVHLSVECTVLWQGPPFCGVHCSMAGSTFLWSALFYGRVHLSVECTVLWQGPLRPSPPPPRPLTLPPRTHKNKRTACSVVLRVKVCSPNTRLKSKPTKPKAP